MVKKLLLTFLLSLVLLQPAFAGNPPREEVSQEEFEEQIAEDQEAALQPVSSPAQCGAARGLPPRNCVFLEEPIGGRPGYDLFIETCSEQAGCVLQLWNGGAIPPNARGPLQAVLSFQPGQESQGPFGLLYNYLGLVYGYMSGLIVAVAILFVVVGGIQMTTSAGDQGKFQNGRDNIIKALVGMVLWFSASLILYTINPTFFTFF